MIIVVPNLNITKIQRPDMVLVDFMNTRHINGFYKCFEHRIGTDSWADFITHIRTNKHETLSVGMHQVTPQTEDESALYTESIVYLKPSVRINGYFTPACLERKLEELKIPRRLMDRHWRCAVR